MCAHLNTKPTSKLIPFLFTCRHYPLLTVYLSLMGRSIFITNYYLRLFSLSDKLKKIRSMISTYERNPNSIPKIREQLSDVSQHAVQLSEILQVRVVCSLCFFVLFFVCLFSLQLLITELVLVWYFSLILLQYFFPLFTFCILLFILFDLLLFIFLSYIFFWFLLVSTRIARGHHHSAHSHQRPRRRSSAHAARYSYIPQAFAEARERPR